MAQRKSGYKPMRHDRYFTPAPAVGALFSAYNFGHVDAWWEPCAGSGHICAALETMGLAPIFASDIAPLPDESVWRGGIETADARLAAPPYLPLERKRVVAVTNLPFGQQGRAIMELLPELIRKVEPTGAVAVLLGVGFDSRPSRHHLFRYCPPFCARVVLTWRLRWANLDQKKAGPSGAHWWAVYDWQQAGKGLPCDVYRSEAEGRAMLTRGVVCPKPLPASGDALPRGALLERNALLEQLGDPTPARRRA